MNKTDELLKKLVDTLCVESARCKNEQRVTPFGELDKSRLEGMQTGYRLSGRLVENLRLILLAAEPIQLTAVTREEFEGFKKDVDHDIGRLDNRINELGNLMDQLDGHKH